MVVTELLYQYDSYRTGTSARVVEVENQNVALDRTVFCPRGGGQLADKGTLTAYTRQFEVIAVEKRGDTVYHTLSGPPPAVGTHVEAQIDWDHRYLMMRTHTALHVLCGIVFRRYGAFVTGCQMYSDRARMDFTLADLSPERLREIETLANDAIVSGYPVRVGWVARSVANTIPDLVRTKINLVPANVDPIRTIDIVGLDLQADGGTHVANTLEIGSLRIVKSENKGRENRRIEIELSPPVIP